MAVPYDIQSEYFTPFIQMMGQCGISPAAFPYAGDSVYATEEILFGYIMYLMS